MNGIEPQEGCLASCMAVLGNKWTAFILRDLTEKPQRFSELERSITGLNPRTLSQRLDDLETHGIITKESQANTGQHTVYKLTQKGEDLIPVLKKMADWGTKYYIGTR